MEPAKATEDITCLIQDGLDRMQGKGKYCHNPHGDVLQFPDLPEGTRAIYYTHYMADDLTIKAKPSITVALLFNPEEPGIIARGISICSPQENAIKKEGRIRAIGRALRAWNKKSTGPLFVHPRAISVIREVYIPETNSLLFGGGYGTDTHKYMWQPTLTKYEAKIVSGVILGMALKQEESNDNDE